MKHIRLTICICALLLIGGNLGLAERAAGFLGTWYLNCIELVGQPLHPSYLHAEETLTIRAGGRMESRTLFEGLEFADAAEWRQSGSEIIANYEDGSEVI